ncbi:MAG: hypothetical protein KJP09_00115 [Bacteroidia bacterium]|nr:hypothetical protein [Bacteroidia bacterium]
MSLKIASLNSNDGLPVEQIHNLDRDTKGRLWLATSSGLACYNGSEVKVYDSRNGIECVGLRIVKVLFNSEVWIGTDQGIEVLDLNGNKKTLNLGFVWKYGIAEYLEVLKDHLYVGTSNGLLKLKLVGESYQLIKTFDLGYVRQLEKLNDDQLLVVSGLKGLVHVDGESYKPFGTVPFEDNPILCVKKTIDNYILLGTERGLFVLDTIGNLVDGLKTNGFDSQLNKINSNGADWWMAFDKKLVHAVITENGLETKATYLIDSKVNDILIDDIHNVWLATNNSGLKKITCLRDALEYVDYGKEGSVYSIKRRNDDGYSFVLSGDGLASQVSYKPFVSNETTSDKIIEIPTIIWDSCIDPIDPNKVWFATQDGLYFTQNGKKPIKFKDPKNLISAPNRVLQVIDDEIWLGTIAGLFCIKDNIVKEVLNDKNQPFGYIYTFVFSENNELWIGTLGQGLWTMKDGEFLNHKEGPLQELGNTYCISFNSKGDAILLQDEKLILVDTSKNGHLIIKEYPMAGWSVTWLTDTTVGIGSNFGVIVVDVGLKEVIRRINLYLDKTDWQFTCSRSIYLHEDRYLMCALNTGLYVINLEEIDAFTRLPEISLDTVSWHNIDPTQKANTYIVPTGKWSVNVSVYCPWFVDENQLRFRFKLIGFDEEWSELADENSTKYNSLPPGNYELHAQVFTPLTGFSEIKTLMNFEVSSPWWFKGVGPVLDSGRTFYNKFFKSKITNKNLLERNLDLMAEIDNRKAIQLELTDNQAQLEDVLENYKHTEEALQRSNTDLRQLSSRLQNLIEDEKKSIAREVHDVLGQQLTSLKFDISWLNTKLKEKEPEYAEKAGSMIGLVDNTINTVRKIASELRPSVLDDLGLEAAIEWHAKAFEKLTDIKCDLQCGELSEKYSDDIKTAVFRIFQESTTNIIRHAKASVVRVRLFEDNNEIVLEVEDNGVGISDERKKNVTSLGLLGMKERVSILDGNFLIRKLPTQGTIVKIGIPFK